MKRLILLPMTVTITALVVTVFSYSIAEGKDSKSIKPRVIYGTDDRLDIYQVTEAKSLQLASSTVALIRSDDLIVKNSDTFTISTSSYSSNYNLCQEEPFYDQRTAAFCSGFLVAPDIIVTAGHCVTSEQSCKNTSFVFDFALKRQGEHPTEARKRRCLQLPKLDCDKSGKQRRRLCGHKTRSPSNKPSASGNSQVRTVSSGRCAHGYRSSRRTSH